MILTIYYDCDIPNIVPPTKVNNIPNHPIGFKFSPKKSKPAKGIKVLVPPFHNTSKTPSSTYE